jgi:transposase-like protein
MERLFQGGTVFDDPALDGGVVDWDPALLHEFFAMPVVFQKWRWTAMNVTLGLIFVASLRKAWPMTFLAVRCLHCQRAQIVKRGTTARGTQRYLCQHTRCPKGSFLRDYDNRGCVPEVQPTMIDMHLHASGVRDTARSLPLCPNTVLRELKKKEAVLEAGNTAYGGDLHPASGSRRAEPRHTPPPEERAAASDRTDAQETLGPQDHLLCKNNPEARPCPWLLCHPLCLWTGGVKMAISTFETLPKEECGMADAMIGAG